MCGIVYSKSFVGKPVNRKIEKLFDAQRTRGTDGFGFYLPIEDRLTHNTREGRIRARLRRAKASEILFHHRLPTSTLNVRNSCHPFSTKDFFEHNYVGVHNGVLWNDEELRKAQLDKGITYVSEDDLGSFNDSEALIYDLAEYIEGRKEFIEASGSIAFVMVQKDSEGKTLATFFGRNHGNPLVMKHTDKHLTLSSEGKGTLIEPHKLYCFNHDTGVITTSPMYLPEGYGSGRRYISGREASGYDGFGFGYNWGLDDDEFEHLEVMSPKDRERFFRNELRDSGVRDYDFIMEERSKVKNEAERLLYDAFDNPYDAVIAGDAELKTLKLKEAELKDKVEVTQTATDKEIEEYCDIGDRIYYLQEAVEAIGRETAGLVQQGFLLPHPEPRRIERTRVEELPLPRPKDAEREEDIATRVSEILKESDKIKSNKWGKK